MNELDLGPAMVLFIFANTVGMLGYLVYHFFYRKEKKNPLKKDSLDDAIDKLEQED